MYKKLFRNKKTVNLVIKDHVIRYVRIKPSNPNEIRGYGERYLPSGIIEDGKIIDEETLVIILEECIEEWNIKDSKVQFIVPDTYIVIRKIHIPVEIDDVEIKDYLFMEIGNSVHLPFEEAVFDFIFLSQDEEMKELLLFAAPEQHVISYASLLEEVHLTPIVADISPLSIYRLYHRIEKASANDHLLLLQFDLKMINASIFHDHKPVFTRHLPLNGNIESWQKQSTENSNLAQLVWIGDRDELLMALKDAYGEIERLMNFYRFSLNQGKVGVNKILLTGDHPEFPMILEQLSRQFEEPIITLSNEKIRTADGANLHANFYLAYGLALKEVH